MLEHLAGIVCGGGYTFLFGNGIFRAVDEVLRGTLNTNDGEEAEGDCQQLLRCIRAESATEAAANGIGKILCAKVGIAAAIADIHDLGIENDGVGNLKNGGGEIGLREFGAATGTEVLMGLTFEDIHVAFTAVKNDLLFHNGNALNFLGSAEAGTNLRDNLHVHGDADLIKAAIEGDAVYADIGADDLGIFGAYAAAAFNELVSDVGKINGNVLKAILVAAAVKNSVCVYIYRITGTAAKGRVVSGIGHDG